jgi:hypothetical protein
VGDGSGDERICPLLRNGVLSGDVLLSVNLSNEASVPKRGRGKSVSSGLRNNVGMLDSSSELDIAWRVCRAREMGNRVT